MTQRRDEPLPPVFTHEIPPLHERRTYLDVDRQIMTDGRITLYIASSVDGFIAAEGGDVSWLEPFEGDDDPAGYEEFFADVDCLLMGSKTYEQVQSFGKWPYGEKPAYVVTSRDLPRASDAVELYDGDVGALLSRLERRYDRTWLVGGAELARTVLRTNQLDQLYLSLVPVLLGSGIRLFDEIGNSYDLHHVSTTTRENGIVELRYDLDG